MFAAILDTCVLWPSLQRDFVLSMAVEGLYRPLWSDAILEELHRHEERKWLIRGEIPGVATRRADHLIRQMRISFDDALVTGWEGLDGSFGLPDPDDEHVVAAAVVGGAGVIVTENLKDIRCDVVPAHIQVLDVREFAANTADVDPVRAARALNELAKPPSQPVSYATGATHHACRPIRHGRCRRNPFTIALRPRLIRCMNRDDLAEVIGEVDSLAWLTGRC